MNKEDRAVLAELVNKYSRYVVVTELWNLTKPKKLRGRNPRDPLQSHTRNPDDPPAHGRDGLYSRQVSEFLSAELGKRPSTLRHHHAKAKKWLRRGLIKLSPKKRELWDKGGGGQSVSLPTAGYIGITDTGDEVGR